MTSQVVSEISSYLQETYFSKLVTIQSDRYKFESGERPRISATRKLIVKFLKVRFRYSDEECMEVIYKFESGFRETTSSDQSNPVSDLVAGLRPAISVTDVNHRFLVNAETYERSRIDIEFYAIATGKKSKDIFDEAIYIDPVYNPRMADSHYPTEVDGRACMAINSYLTPYWFNTEAKPQIPTLFKGLIDHLIVTEEAKVYFYDWLYKSLTDRAYTFLVLCGQKGIGKGQLQKLIRALHGANNFVEGKRGTIGGQFNSQLQDSRVVWFDEIHYDKPDVNNMKRMLNDIVSIEKKGIDATKSTHIHCSIVLSNNELADNYIELDDRRFSPLELTDINLTKVFDANWFDEFNQHTDDLADESPLVAEFGKWILEYGKSDKIGKQEPYKGEKFNQIVLSSLRMWQDNTVNFILDEKSVDSRLKGNNFLTYADLRSYNEIKHKDSGVYPKKNKVIDFLRTYVDPDSGEKLVEVYRVGREDRIVPIYLVDNYLRGFKEVKGYENKSDTSMSDFV